MTMIITRRDAAPQGGDDDWLGGRIEEYKGHRIGLWKLLPPTLVVVVLSYCCGHVVSRRKRFNIKVSALYILMRRWVSSATEMLWWSWRRKKRTRIEEGRTEKASSSSLGDLLTIPSAQPQQSFQCCCSLGGWVDDQASRGPPPASVPDSLLLLPSA